MKIETNVEDYENEFYNLANLFPASDAALSHFELDLGNKIINKFELKGDEPEYFEEEYSINESNPLMRKRLRKRKAKIGLYHLFSKVFKTSLPWGSLTGIRPTRLARELIEEEGVKEQLVGTVLEKEFCVRNDKAKLVSQILKAQKCIIRNDNLVDLYINIPICPTRCLYCSFISSVYSAVKSKIDDYLDCLIKELNAVKEIVTKKALIIRTIYIGGGTPSVLNDRELERLLSAISFPVGEFTVECGRPDTITKEKLDILKKYGVTRLSINPQTFCEATLKRIGRNHKNSQVFEAYSLALERGFEVNMDIIAGLPGEKFGVFKRTISTLLELAPDNITVHTLSVKNGASLKEDTSILSEKDVPKMVDYARETLMENGYKPYYMYRQKNQLCGLENVGFYRDKVCIFNIDSMEETNSIIAIGAGAMSKRVFNIEKRIERQSNPKFIEDYIQRIDEIIEKKQNFYK